jgi:ElaB/YqjD/DUF883 family membrane-anchored ribosome-binding protein
MKNNENRSPEEIESDIERTRADFSSTIDAIQRKLSPTEMMDQAVDYALSTPPGAFGMKLVNTVRDNPVPIALIGIGVAWLMASGRKSEYMDTRERYPRSVRRSSQSVYRGEGYDAGYESDYLAARDYGTDAESNGLMNRVASKAGDATESIKGTASQVGQRISETASSVTGRLQQASQTARSRLGESAETAQQRLTEMSRRTQEQARYATDRMSQMLNEQPLVFGALGLAVGAALGATIPTTRRENEMLGEVRDNLVGKAKETAMSQVETLKQTAQRVAETAKQEVERATESISSAATQSKDGGMQSASTGGTANQYGSSTTPPSIH